MSKVALMAASVAVFGFATPSFASDTAAAGRIQLAQAGVSVSVGDGPRVRSGVVVRDRDRGYRRGYRHYGRGDNVVIVKKRKPARKTVIIER
jgi:hypothetical protein